MRTGWPIMPSHCSRTRRVLARAREIDARIVATRHEWDGAALAVTPWLERIARIDAEPWWLDRVALATLRARTNANALLAKPSTTKPLELVRPKRQELAEVVGQEDTLARGVVVARMFDGEVDVLLVDTPFGIHLRCAEKIDDATLAGTRGFATGSTWWLRSTDQLEGSIALVVTLRGAIESLPIEF